MSKSNNQTGNILEQITRKSLETAGYTFQKNTYKGPLDRVFFQRKQYGTSIYGSKQYVDFLVFKSPTQPYIIECKWQQVTGSADQKYPFLVANILKNKVPTYVVLSGGGYSSHAAAWLKSCVDGCTLLGVYDSPEFQALANKGML